MCNRLLDRLVARVFRKPIEWPVSLTRRWRSGLRRGRVPCDCGGSMCRGHNGWMIDGELFRLTDTPSDNPGLKTRAYNTPSIEAMTGDPHPNPALLDLRDQPSSS